MTSALIFSFFPFFLQLQAPFPFFPPPKVYITANT